MYVAHMGRSSGGAGVEDISGFEVWSLDKPYRLSEIHFASSGKCILSFLPHFYLIVVL